MFDYHSLVFVNERAREAHLRPYNEFDCCNAIESYCFNQWYFRDYFATVSRGLLYVKRTALLSWLCTGIMVEQLRAMDGLYRYIAVSDSVLPPNITENVGAGFNALMWRLK